jgi:hypothetical protein
MALTPARLLRETLAHLPPDTPVLEGDRIFESGEPDWMDRAAASRADASRSLQAAPERIVLRSERRRTRSLERMTPSGPDADTAVDVDAILGIGRGEGSLGFGTLIHAWLETLEWSDTGLAPESDLRDIAGRVAPERSPQALDSTLAWLRDRLANPAIDRALRLSAWPEGTKVERELPFLVREHDVLLEGTLDRLLLTTDPKGRVSEAIVMDYKTDRGFDDHVLDNARLDHYRAQVGAYCRAVRSLYGLDADRVRGLLLFLDSGLIVEIEREPNPA